MLPTLRSVPIALAAASLLAPAAAHAATTSKTVYPRVDSIAPRKLAIGETLTIKGKNLRSGKTKTTVVFQRAGKPAVFVKANSATTTRLVLRVPEKLGAFLAVKDGGATPTAFRLRVLTKRFAKTWTSVSRSPVIAPKPAVVAPPAGGGDPAAPGKPGAPGTPAPQLTPYELCQIAAKADPAADADKDGLPNGTELGLTYPTDPCNADTDGDSMVDGYEYFSAVDLNVTGLIVTPPSPYPGKRPWPNPLDGTDGTFDFDGDGLSLGQESTLWKYAGGTFPLTAYSDGTQNTNGTKPVVTAEDVALDLDGDTNLTDDERDADGDGLSNIVETNLTGTVEWWSKVKRYENEKPYVRAKFVEPSATDPDTDGDGILDGADDQDHDSYNNVAEMQDPWRAKGLRIQPFNPCLPDPYALTCSRWLILGTDPWPPFDGSAVPFDTILPGQGSMLPLQSPDVLTNNPALAWNGNGGPQGS